MPASKNPRKETAGKSRGGIAARSRGRPRREDVAELENKLLEVALREFREHGYGGASVSRIVKNAGVSKTTLYSRFESKEQLFRAIMQRQVLVLAPARLLSANGDALSLEAGLKAYADHMLKLSLQGDLLEVNRLIYSESHRFPELGAAAAERTELGIRRIADFIRERATADGIPCRDPEAVAEVFIFMIRGWYINAMLTKRKVSASQRQRWVERVVHALVGGRSEW